jgi:hypothetical protein
MGIINGSGYNIGVDIGVAVTDNFGDAFPIDALGHMMDFDSAADDNEIKVVPITNGGKPIFQTVWVGGHGRITFTRVNGNLQAMVLELMSAYHNLGIIPVFSLATSILNRDSSIDEYLYTGVQFRTPHFGNYAALKEVNTGLDFSWSDCIKTGGPTSFLTELAAAE